MDDSSSDEQAREGAEAAAAVDAPHHPDLACDCKCYSVGYAYGFKCGMDKGVVEGTGKGKEKGFSKGKDKGWYDGYDLGYQGGMNAQIRDQPNTEFACCVKRRRVT